MLPTVISAHVNSPHPHCGIDGGCLIHDRGKKSKHDGQWNDDLFTQVQAQKIGTFTIPVCSYGQPNAKVHLTLECSISRMESGRYNREMYLDCLYFKPNREE